MGSKIPKEQLAWITPKNEIQANWLLNYIYKKRATNFLKFVFLKIQEATTTEDKVKAFKEEASNSENTAETRELFRLMKSAWNQKKKRKKSPLKNGEFCISPEAYSELKWLSRKGEISQSKVIENALLDLNKTRKKNKEMEQLQKEITKLQNSLTLKEEKLSNLIKVNTNKQRTLDHDRAYNDDLQNNLNHRIADLELKEADLAKRITMHEMNI